MSIINFIPNEACNRTYVSPCNDIYFQLLTCLDPGYYIIFSKPPLSSCNNQMKKLLATEYETWVLQSSHNISQEAVSVPSSSTIAPGNSGNEGWASFFSGEWEIVENTEEQPMAASNPGSQNSCMIIKQFEEYCDEPHQPVEPTISVKHLKERGNELHQYWQSKKRQWPELSTFPLCHSLARVLG